MNKYIYKNDENFKVEKTNQKFLHMNKAKVETYKIVSMLIYFIVNDQEF